MFGNSRARAPVAMMMCLAWNSPTVVVPSFSTLILPLPSRVAWPSMTVTLFFFSRCLTPPESWEATPRDRLTTFWRSKLTSLAEKP